MSEYEYPPGSQEARERDCSCPTIDNEFGRGYMGTDEYVVNFDCPLHGKE
jgi:hypothetical protein